MSEHVTIETTTQNTPHLDEEGDAAHVTLTQQLFSLPNKLKERLQQLLLGGTLTLIALWKREWEWN